MKSPNASVAVDTNLLLRALVDDSTASGQCDAARQFLSRMTDVYVSQIVQVELGWVLRRVYAFSREEIAQVLQRLRSNLVIRLQFVDAFDAALELYRSGADFADALIVYEASRVQVELVTFDKKLASRLGARLLKSWAVHSG